MKQVRSEIKRPESKAETQHLTINPGNPPKLTRNVEAHQGGNQQNSPSLLCQSSGDKLQTRETPAVPRTQEVVASLTPQVDPPVVGKDWGATTRESYTTTALATKVLRTVPCPKKVQNHPQRERDRCGQQREQVN